jgi:predicted NBD/HSP70 family sugar kinase
MIYVPSRMGQLNRRALLRQLQRLGTASRAELAKALGMSQPTAGKIVDELMVMDVVEEIAEAAPGNGLREASTALGRPGRKLRLNQSRPKFLGIHLGVTTTTLAALSLGGESEDRWPVSFEVAATDPAPARTWRKQLRTAIGSFDGGFLGVILSVPGVVDEASNRVLFSPNIHWTEKTDIAAMAEQICGVPALLVQEVRALALGHHQMTPHSEDFLLVDIGEGLGGAVVVQGKPLAGPLPISGEIGHTPVPGNTRRCGCGATGCVETLVSIRGLLASFAEAVPGSEPSWSRLHDHVLKHGVTPWLARSLDPAGAAIAGALNVLGLNHAVITGCLAQLPPAVIQYFSRRIEKGAMWARFGRVECVSAPRRRTAGMAAVGVDRLIVPDTVGNFAASRTSYRTETARVSATPVFKRGRKAVSRALSTALK